MKGKENEEDERDNKKQNVKKKQKRCKNKRETKEPIKGEDWEKGKKQGTKKE